MKLFVVVVAVVLSVFFSGASQLPGCEAGRAVVVASSPSSSSPSVFVLGRAGGQSALELGEKLFAIAAVSFGVGCETVRRRRLFLFWGGRGASQLWSWV